MRNLCAVGRELTFPWTYLAHMKTKLDGRLRRSDETFPSAKSLQAIRSPCCSIFCSLQTKIMKWLWHFICTCLFVFFSYSLFLLPRLFLFGGLQGPLRSDRACRTLTGRRLRSAQLRPTAFFLALDGVRYETINPANPAPAWPTESQWKPNLTSSFSQLHFAQRNRYSLIN